jgi:hypothetical protein
MTTAADIKWTRELLKAELEEKVDWRRRKAVEYPNDRRNRDAAKEYERLAKTVKDIPDDLLVEYLEAFEDAPDSERWHEMLNDIFRGFGPADATEVIEIYRDAGINGAKGRDGRPGRVRPISADILRRLRRDYGK